MKRFFARISEKARDVSAAPVLIAALGDSVTQGVMEHQFLDSGAVYHRHLQAWLESFYPTTSFSTINAGVSGGTAASALNRLERDVLRHHPDLVLVAFGLNDCLAGTGCLDTFTGALLEIVDRVQESTSADIALLTPPFMARRSNFRIHPDHAAMAEGIIANQNNGVLSLYADSIRKVAADRQVLLVDVYREWTRLAEDGLDTDMWLINGLNHPDSRGHALAATMIFHTLLSQRDGSAKENE